MKSLKAAAVLAGSLIAAAMAAPASAQELDLASTGLDTGLNTRTAVPFELMPLHDASDGEEHDTSVFGTAHEAAAVVNEAKPVHGDLGLHA
ncbi:hypothetical protein DIZ27_16480 [Streptomyces sp. NWU339]|uniref:hypothetical protein n=1 Tax=Streptomyces sp. NWU339 TaxID=2185284 RepID=UPI000D6803A2|nr:hypothetical protein [Streptomyces sp. NWU339]PWI09665.1 hypothetical protein DIZ27_16480 [Streptomyces sp. NWU339]